MDQGVPLLNPEQIEQLNNMVMSILDDNKKKLDDLLSESVQLQNTSILNLYNLVVQQWGKKQKTIDNLCHFALTMMSTVHLLWQQKYQNQQRLSSVEVVIDSLQKHIQDLGEENDLFKLKMHQAETHIESISGEKDKFEQLYRSQSCCGFNGLGYLSQTNDALGDSSQKCAACCQQQNILEEQKSQIMRQSSKILCEKDGEISILRQEKKQLQKKLEELRQEHDLAKMEVQLAEIAVKDALSYRESSISSRSQIMSRNDEVFTTRSHAQFMNGQLECFSNLDQSFNFQRKNILINQISSCEEIVHFSASSIPNQQEDYIFTKKQKQTDDLVAAPANPFKKKMSLITETDQLYTQTQQTSLKPQKKKFDLNALKAKKTVSLQCNLIKNVPKLKFFQKKTPVEQPKNKVTTKPVSKPGVPPSKKDKPLSKSMIVASKVEAKQIKKQLPNAIKKDLGKQSQSSLTRLYNFISSKIITQRIRVK